MVKKLLVKNRDKLLSELTQDVPAHGIITAGNDQSATLELKGDAIAPEQFVIICEQDKTTLLCRVDGTTVNGNLLAQGALHDLEAGDEIGVGDYSILIETAANAELLMNGKSAVNQPKLPVADAAALRDEPPAATATAKTERSLSDVLDNLRSEERFYFRIETTAGENRRVYVEEEEMWLGWANSGDCVLTVETSEIAVPRAQIRKDWSGVVLYPLQTTGIWLNDEILAEPRRLKNDDSFALLAKEGAKPCAETLVRFHEPTALLVLDSILPKELPPPILINDRRKNAVRPAETADAAAIHTTKTPISALEAAQKKLFFGYFTAIEIFVMAIGTLVTAAMIFLILEFY